MKIGKILLVLIVTILFTGCSDKKESIKLVEASSGGFAIYENDNIKIKIADNIDEKESIYKSILKDLHKIDKFSPIENLEVGISKQYLVPNTENIIKCDTKFIETEEFKKELIKKSYGIYDNWITEGLYWKIFEQYKTIDFSKYYVKNDFSLFGARYFEPFASKEEIESVKSASIDLVEYLLKNNRKTELLKNDIKVSDMENWAKDKGIDLDYQRELESLMNRMEATNNMANKFVINTKEEINGFKIDINIEKINEQYSTARKIEQLILRFDRDIIAVKRGIEKDAPEFYSEYKEVLNNVPKIEYIFDTNVEGFADGGYTIIGTEKIHLRNVNVHSHEYSHLLFHSPFMKKGIVVTKPVWLNEGIADYLFGVYSEAYIEEVENNLYFLSNPTELTELLETQNYTDNEIKELKNLFANELNIYFENDIDINNIEEIAKNENKRIIENYLRYLYIVKSRQIRGSKVNDGSAPLDLMSEGDTMDYIKNYSFFYYLVGEYGLDKMLYLNVANFSKLTYKEVFGKTFYELKVDWMKYLKENIKGIESIL